MLQEAEKIVEVPLLSDLTVAQAKNFDPADGKRATGRRNSHELALVGAMMRVPRGDEIAFGHQFLDRRGKPRKRGAKSSKNLLVGVSAVMFAQHRRTMIDKISREQLIIAPAIARVLEKCPDHRLVRLE